MLFRPLGQQQVIRRQVVRSPDVKDHKQSSGQAVQWKSDSVDKNQEDSNVTRHNATVHYSFVLHVN